MPSGGGSPIVLNSSSSPEIFREPTATPPSKQNPVVHAISSSPKLPSPSQFLRPKPGDGNSTKSSSCARKIPEGVATGFASASAVWDLRKVEDQSEVEAKRLREEEETAKRITNDEVTVKKGKGKLARPSKKEQSASTENEQGAETGKAAGTRRFSPADHVFEDRGTARTGMTGQDQRREVSAPSPAAAPCLRRPSKKPSIELDEFAFRETDEAVGAAVKAPAKAAKKPRREAVKVDALQGGEPNAAAKKPSRRKIQSEAVVLNSDEEEPQPLPVMSESVLEKPSVEQVLYKAKKQRRRKGDGEAPVAEIGEAAQTERKRGRPSKKACETATLEKSTCFPQPPQQFESAAPVEPVAIEVNLLQTNAETVTTKASGTASFRRRSWTPVKDTSTEINGAVETPVSHGAGQVAETASPRANLTELLGGFCYTETDHATPSRTVSGGFATKRRRVEVPKPTEAGEAPTKDAEAPAPIVKVKKGKQPPKRAQTITALATAAYMPAAQPESEGQQGTVPEFFASAKPPVPPTIGSVPGDATNTAKPKKLRKSRANAQPEGPTAKPKKGKKAKADEKVQQPPLLSPDHFRARMGDQDFLFGTSSQLAGEESPSFLREMQLAVRESEVSATQHGTQLGTQTQIRRSAQGKSCARVPTAPHGTSLSVEQAGRELWCVSARDHEEGTLAAEERVAVPAGDEIDSHRFDVPVDTQIPLPWQSGREERHGIEETGELLSCSKEELDQDTQDSGFVYVTSPPAQTSSHAQNVEDDDWMLLKSDESNVPSAELPATSTSRDDMPSTVQSSKYGKPPVRTALQPLDSNFGMTSHTSLAKATSAVQATFSDTRAFATSTMDAPPATSPAKKKRGRPRKEEMTALSPKRRGRPRKAPTAAAEAAAPQKSQQGTSQTEWHNIDEIDDSDAPVTPSSPRRRATWTPPAAPPPDLAPPASPSKQPIQPTAAPPTSTATTTSATLKPTDSRWPTITASLFPQITSTIRSTPRSTSLRDPPNWHEKILLYDPIVLEDLTDWLNAQGLRARVERQVEVAKKKGRKRKVQESEVKVSEMEGSVLKGQTADASLTEVKEEELKAWMVQKWCEERGVCCLWREGLRGGVKARY